MKLFDGIEFKCPACGTSLSGMTLSETWEPAYGRVREWGARAPHTTTYSVAGLLRCPSCKLHIVVEADACLTPMPYWQAKK